MTINITMPALSPTMTEGALTRWLKKEGDSVAPGEAIAEIETDKATMEVEAADEGRLAKIVVAGGTAGVKVGTVIGVLQTDGESEMASPSPPPVAAKPRAAAPEVPPPRVAPTSVAEPAPAPRHEPATRLFASPLAKRLAKERGIDLLRIAGSGPHGRIIAADVAGIGAGVTSLERAPSQAPVGEAGGSTKDRVQVLAGGAQYRLVPHSGMRQTIARRLTEAKRTVPHFYLTIDCMLDRLTATRAELGVRFPEHKPSVNDFVIKAAALALREVPRANASWSDEGTLLWDSVDVAVAVALEDGLITPIIRAADTKPIQAISSEMKDLAARARAGKLKLQEFQGGTFSVSNLGMYGIRDFAAVINPPQGCILAVGAGEERAVAKNGVVTAAMVMSCTLSVDHRVVDGAVGAQFLQAFKRLIEAPSALLV